MEDKEKLKDIGAQYLQKLQGKKKRRRKKKPVPEKVDEPGEDVTTLFGDSPSSKRVDEVHEEGDVGDLFGRSVSNVRDERDEKHEGEDVSMLFSPGKVVYNEKDEQSSDGDVSGLFGVGDKNVVEDEVDASSDDATALFGGGNDVSGLFGNSTVEENVTTENLSVNDDEISEASIDAIKENVESTETNIENGNIDGIPEEDEIATIEESLKDPIEEFIKDPIEESIVNLIEESIENPTEDNELIIQNIDEPTIEISPVDTENTVSEEVNELTPVLDTSNIEYTEKIISSEEIMEEPVHQDTELVMSTMEVDKIQKEIENQSYDTEIENRSQEFDNLFQENVNLKNENEELTVSVELKEKIIENLESQISNMKIELSCEKEELEESNSELEKQVVALEEIENNLSNDIQNKDNEISLLLQDIQELRDLYQNEQDKVNELEVKTEFYLSEIDTLSMKVEDSETDVKYWESLYNSLQNESSVDKNTLLEKDDEISILLEKNDKLEKSMKLLENDLAESQITIQDFETPAGEMQIGTDIQEENQYQVDIISEKDVLINSLEKTVMEINEELTVSKTVESDLIAALSNQEVQVHQYLNDLNNQISSIIQKSDSIDKMKKDYKNLERNHVLMCEHNEKTVTFLRNELENQDHTISDLTNQLSCMETAIIVLKNENKEMVHEHESALKILRNQIIHFETTMQMAENIQEIDVMSTAVDEKSETIRRLERELSQLEKEKENFLKSDSEIATSLKSQLTELETKEEAYIKEIEVQTHNIQSHLKMIESLKFDLETGQSQVNDVLEKLKSREQELSHKTDIVNNLTVEIETLKTTFVQLEKENMSLHDDTIKEKEKLIAKLESTLTEKTEMLEKAKVQFKKFKTSHAQKQSEIQGLNEELENAKLSVSEGKIKNEGLIEELHNLHSTVVELQRTISERENTISDFGNQDDSNVLITNFEERLRDKAIELENMTNQLDEETKLVENLKLENERLNNELLAENEAKSLLLNQEKTIQEEFVKSLNEKETTIQTKSNMIEKLVSEITRLNSEKETLELSLQDTNKLNETQNQDEIKNYISEILELKEDKKLLLDEIKNYESYTDSLKEDYDQSISNLSLKDEEIDSIKQYHTKEIENMEDMIEKLSLKLSSQVENSRTTHQKLTTELSTLFEEKTNLENDIHVLHSEQTRIIKEKKISDEIIENYKKEIESLKSTYDEKIFEIEKHREDLINDISDHKQQKEAHTKELEILQEKYSQKLQKYKSKISEGSTEELSMYKNQVDELNLVIKKQSSDYQNLMDDVSDYSQTNTELAQLVEKQALRINALVEEVNELIKDKESSLKKAEKSVTELQEKNNELFEQITAGNENLREIQKKNTQIELLEKKVNTISKKMQDLFSLNETLESTNTKLNEQINDLQLNNTALQKQATQEKNYLRNQLEEIRLEQSEQNDIVNEFLTEKQNATMKIEKLNDKIISLNAEKSSIQQEYLDRISALREEKQIAISEFNKLSGSVEELTERNGVLESLLKSEQNSHTSKIEHYTTEIMKKDEIIKTISEEMKIIDSSKQNLESLYEKNRFEMENAFKNNIQKLRSNNEALQLENTDLVNRIETLNSQVQNHNLDENEKIKIKYNEILHNFKALEIEKETIERNFENYKLSSSLPDTDIAKENQQLVSQLESNAKTIELLQSELQELEMSTRKGNHDKLETQLETLVAENAELSKKIQEQAAIVQQLSADKARLSSPQRNNNFVDDLSSEKRQLSNLLFQKTLEYEELKDEYDEAIVLLKKSKKHEKTITHQKIVIENLKSRLSEEHQTDHSNDEEQSPITQIMSASISSSSSSDIAIPQTQPPEAGWGNIFNSVWNTVMGYE